MDDKKVLRDLAKQVADIAAKPVQDERRDLWRRHNSLERTRPLVIVLGMPYWQEVFPDDKLQCKDPFLREHERSLRQKIHQDMLNDDTVIEPFITVAPVYATLCGDERWGAPMHFVHSTESRGAGYFEPPVKTEEDISRIVPQPHRINETTSIERFNKIRDAVGDIIHVYLNRAPIYSGWHADMSTDVARLLGLENFMLYMLDRPEWLHKVQALMRDGVLAQQQQAEDAGDWHLFNHNSQAMCYCRELAGPSEHTEPVKRDKLWAFFASQETTLVSPTMFDEFVLQYQIPIISKFGLSAYGCCEDLTNKVHLVKKIPNLRRFSVTPWADVAKCAELIGTDYVFSWRPSPAEMICRGYDAKRARKLTREGLKACKGCHVDITLKDVETIGGRFDQLINWVKVVREVSGK